MAPVPGWLRRLAALTALSTLFLLGAGALVTSTDSGMAFPDWPTSAGHNLFAYPWFQAARKEFIEHGHRLLGAAIGVLTLALAFGLWARGSRGLKLLGLLAAAGVLLQGILGGLRVRLDSRALAFLHACLAYAFFGLLAAIWARTRPGPAPEARAGRLAWPVAMLLYLQIVTGAALRQLKAPVELHFGMAVLTTALVCRLAYLLLQGEPAWHRTGLAIAGLVLFQASLGAASWLSLQVAPDPRSAFSAVLHTVLHVLTGATLLGVLVGAAVRLDSRA